MAYEHLENWEPFGVGGQAYLTNNVYAEASNVEITNSPSGAGLALRMNPGPGGLVSSLLRYVLSSANDRVGILARFWLDTLPLNVDQRPAPFVFRSTGNVDVLSVQIDPSGYLQILGENLSGPALFRSSGPVVSANTMNHLEAWVDYAVGGATLSIRKEGVPIDGLTDLTVPTVTAANVSQVVVAYYRSSNFAGTPPNMFVQDFGILNGESSQNNSFRGSVLMKSKLTTSDIALDWATTGANGFSILDNSPPADAAYISAAYNPGGPPYYPTAYVGALSELPDDVTSVQCLMTIVRAMKVDGGDGNMQVGLISSPASAPVTGLGANRPITAAMSYWRDFFPLDPKTSAAWTPSAANLPQIQIGRTL